MNVDAKILQEKIDYYKSILNSLVLKNSITDNEIVNYSQMLDKYIVEYQKLIFN
ncbi:aspartyl-phosphate phosphatase Spo0E family protein [Clostridium ihumii]|uniref:aspartyl-phosphate phosphatase Spo0E family protein n=1 Tax=Clostridium ihumii TaxID=1470356 RepID=UPI0009441612|nr:aspartyl-phosphate phosphatase Spo0E family protein [Clostridium ihumii]